MHEAYIANRRSLDELRRSAVGEDGLSCDECAGILEQEGDQRADLTRLPWPAEGRIETEVLDERPLVGVPLALGNVSADGMQRIGFHRAGATLFARIPEWPWVRAIPRVNVETAALRLA